MDTTLDPATFQQLIENLCADFAADSAAAHCRLERLRRLGPDDERSED